MMTSGIVVWETGIKTKDNVSENIKLSIARQTGRQPLLSS